MLKSHYTHLTLLILAACIPPLDAFRTGMDWWSPIEVAIPIFIGAIFLMSLYVLIGKILPKYRAIIAILLSLSFLLLFQFENIYNLVKIDYGYTLSQAQYLISAAIALIVLPLLLRVISPNTVNFFLRVFMLLLTVGLGGDVLFNYNWQQTNSKNPDLVPAINPSLPAPAQENLPDIYYIVLDGYGNNKHCFKPLYSQDNDTFLTSLKQAGFYIAEDSHSNYIQTLLTLSSMLNLEYLDHLFDNKKMAHFSSRGPLKVAIHNSAIFTHAKKLGYRFHRTENMFITSEMYSKKLPSRFGIDYRLLSMTPFLNDILELLNDKSYERKQALIHAAFDKIKRLASTPHTSPQLIFSHLLLPHPPFIFKADGTFVKPEEKYGIYDGSHLYHQWSTLGITPTKEAFAKRYQQQYMQQLQYLNTKLLDMVHTIKSKSTRPFVILLHGDHGPASMLDWDDIYKSNAEERSGILNSFYFSDQNYKKLYPTITPVNSFRVIAQQYWGQSHIKLLPDKTYLSSWPKPYEFIAYDPKNKQLK